MISNKYPASEISVLDIGSRGGLSSLGGKFTTLGESELKYQGIDADNIQTDKSEIAVSNHEGEEKLFITEAESASSLFRPKLEFLENFPDIEEGFKIKEERNVNTATLDQFVSRNELDVDFLKSDTQGSEYQILEKGKTTLNQTLSLELEVHFKRLYEEQRLFEDVHSLLREENFELIDLNFDRWNSKGKSIILSDETHRQDYLSNTELVEADALYVSEDIKSLEELVKLTKILLCYGKIDVAIRKIKESSIENSDELRKILEEF